ncbi:MAG: hypothetical protein Q4D62_15890 [Planctomycetia bacterium]|nr:hypothetical protein [Planctomycetia bacterium]
MACSWKFWSILLGGVLAWGTFCVAQEEADAEPSEEVEIQAMAEDESEYGYFFDKEKGRQFGDAGVRAILATKPETVLELVKAAKLITQLERYEIAIQMFQKVKSLNPTEEDAYELAVQMGQNYFLALSMDERLAPDGTALGKWVLETLEKRYSDSEVIEGLLRQLSDPQADVRRQALQELRSHSSVAIPAMVLGLGQAETGGEKEALTATLWTFGEAAVDAVTAVLDSEDETLRAAALEFLAMQSAVRYPMAEVALYRAVAMGWSETVAGKSVPKQEVAEYLQKRLTTVLQDKAQLLAIGTDATIRVLWRWSAEKQTLLSQTGNTLEVLEWEAYQLATALWHLLPNHPGVRQQYLLTTFEQIVSEVGTSSEAILASERYQAILEADFTTTEMEALLRNCLEKRFYTAAILAVVFLGESQEVAWLQPRAGETLSTLVQTLKSPNRSLRFAGLETIMKWQPQKPFPGSSLVMETLVWFLTTEGKSKVLIVERDIPEANILGGRFLSHGYAFDMATSAKEMFERATSSSDYVLVAIDMDILNQVPDLILQPFSQSAKLADLPIVLLAWSEDYQEAEKLAETTPRCVWFPYPTMDSDLELLLTQTQRIFTSTVISPQQREAETRKCLAWALEIAHSHQGGWVEKRSFAAEKTEESGVPQTLYDISDLSQPLIPMLMKTTFAKEAADALAWLGTPTVQSALVSVALAGKDTPEISQKCVAALEQNILRFGVLLTTQQIADLYEQYNTTRKSDKVMLKIRGAILDALEKPLLPPQKEEGRIDN